MYKRINELLGTAYKSDKDIDFRYICRDLKLSEDFIEEFSDRVRWDLISECQTLSEDFIRKHKNQVQLRWDSISSYQRLSENFIEEFKGKLDWDCISKYQILSEEFIEKYKNKLNWEEISIYQDLSESFIEKYKDQVDWYWISYEQFLSESFIERYKDKIDFMGISGSQVLSPRFMEEYKDKLDLRRLNLCQPFITEVISKDDIIIPDYLPKNYLSEVYQETKDRGWFLGYVWKDIHGIFRLIDLVEVNDSDDTSSSMFHRRYRYSYKARIYWRNLMMIERLREYQCQLLRFIKYV